MPSFGGASVDGIGDALALLSRFLGAIYLQSCGKVVELLRGVMSELHESLRATRLCALQMDFGRCGEISGVEVEAAEAARLESAQNLPVH